MQVTRYNSTEKLYDNRGYHVVSRPGAKFRPKAFYAFKIIETKSRKVLKPFQNHQRILCSILRYKPKQQFEFNLR